MCDAKPVAVLEIDKTADADALWVLLRDARGLWDVELLREPLGDGVELRVAEGDAVASPDDEEHAEALADDDTLLLVLDDRDDEAESDKRAVTVGDREGWADLLGERLELLHADVDGVEDEHALVLCEPGLDAEARAVRVAIAVAHAEIVPSGDAEGESVADTRDERDAEGDALSVAVLLEDVVSEGDDEALCAALKDGCSDSVGGGVNDGVRVEDEENVIAAVDVGAALLVAQVDDDAVALDVRDADTVLVFTAVGVARAEAVGDAADVSDAEVVTDRAAEADA